MFFRCCLPRGDTLKTKRARARRLGAGLANSLPGSLRLLQVLMGLIVVSSSLDVIQFDALQMDREMDLYPCKPMGDRRLSQRIQATIEP